MLRKSSIYRDVKLNVLITSTGLSLQKGFAGVVKSTNKMEIEIQPYGTVTLSGFTRKKGNIETAITEQT